MSFINKIWYEGSIIGLIVIFLLMPFTLIFKIVSAIRRILYSSGIKKSQAPDIPVVVVGGITAGGSGKTPLCSALLRELIRQGYKPGLLSRGYKAKSSVFPLEVKADSDPKLTGDEPLLIKRQTGAITVIDPDRVRGAFYLKSLGADIIICDDGLQHYALSRDVEIAVLEGGRMLGNGFLLPSGPLREGKWRLGTVNATVVNGAVARVGYFSMVLKTSSIVSIKDGSAASIARGEKVCALAGIGNPARFYKTLEDYGFAVAGRIEVGDHEKADLKKIKEAAKNMPVIMTAKDAIKYDGNQLDNVYVLNVEAQFSHVFYEHILSAIRDSANKVKLRKNSSNEFKFDRKEQCGDKKADAGRKSENMNKSTDSASISADEKNDIITTSTLPDSTDKKL